MTPLILNHETNGYAKTKLNKAIAKYPKNIALVYLIDLRPDRNNKPVNMHK
jgi:hypothetical protein